MNVRELRAVFVSAALAIPTLATDDVQTRLTLSLRDGSTVVGLTEIERLALKTEFGDAAIPIEQLLAVQIDSRGRAQFQFRNEDRLTGRFDAKRIKLQSSLGELDIALSNITRIGIALLRKGGAGVATEGLVLHYSFDRGTGETVEDLSGNGNHGKIAGARWAPDERYGQVLEFDGQRAMAHVRVPASPSLRLDHALTLAARYKTRSSAEQLLVMWYEGIHLMINCHSGKWGVNGTGANLVENDATDSGRGVINTSDPTINEWHHLAVTYDRDTGKAAVFVDGRISRERHVGSFRPATDQDVILGVLMTSPHVRFDGRIADIQIYNRALSADEVAAAANR